MKYLISLYRRILGEDLSEHWREPDLSVFKNSDLGEPELKPRILRVTFNPDPRDLIIATFNQEGTKVKNKKLEMVLFMLGGIILIPIISMGFVIAVFWIGHQIGGNFDLFINSFGSCSR